MKRLTFVSLFLLVWLGSLQALDRFEEHVRDADPASLRFLETEEDLRRLGVFSAMYKMAKSSEPIHPSIPKTLHMIWVGPLPFPAESVERLRGWVEHHPDWKFKFWTDQERDPGIVGVERCLLGDFPLGGLKECYYASDNFGEKSLVLRYAILFKEGGVYIDHDVECLKPLDPLLSTCDFLCGMAPLTASIVSSSVNASPHLIGCAPQHPILEATAKWLEKEWERLERQYPGDDASSIYNRVAHRSIRAIDVGIKSAHNRNGRRDVVFPPDYFSIADPKKAQFALHASFGSWYERSSDEERKVYRLLEKAIDKSNYIFFLAIGLTAINLCAAVLFFSQHFHKRKRT